MYIRTTQRKRRRGRNLGGFKMWSSHHPQGHELSSYLQCTAIHKICQPRKFTWALVSKFAFGFQYMGMIHWIIACVGELSPTLWASTPIWLVFLEWLIFILSHLLSTNCLGPTVSHLVGINYQVYLRGLPSTSKTHLALGKFHGIRGCLPGAMIMAPSLFRWGQIPHCSYRQSPHCSFGSRMFKYIRGKNWISEKYFLAPCLEFFFPLTKMFTRTWNLYITIITVKYLEKHKIY